MLTTQDRTLSRQTAFMKSSRAFLAVVRSDHHPSHEITITDQDLQVVVVCRLTRLLPCSLLFSIRSLPPTVMPCTVRKLSTALFLS